MTKTREIILVKNTDGITAVGFFMAACCFLLAGFLRTNFIFIAIGCAFAVPCIIFGMSQDKS